MNPTLDRLTAALSDRYRLERELGQGGMATVYLAEDLKHARKVAIKVLHPELSAVIGGDRFLTEIKVTAGLQHPHILGLIDSGAVPLDSGLSTPNPPSLLYYVMPYVSGESLRNRLTRDKQLPIDDALRLAKEVASALDYAHRQGVVHRDIKPENILLQDGNALVADFGIALAVQQAGGSRMTQTGMSLGTPAYMSPEQAMGERDIGARSDVYALGAMTYEMLTGEPPFTGLNSQAIVAKVLTEQPPLLRPKRPMVPPAVEAAVLTALQKLPADRYGSAREFAEALEGRGGNYASTVVTSRPHVLTSSRPRRLGLIAAAALISIAAGTAGWLLRGSPRAPSLPARYQLNLPGLQRANLRYSGSSIALSGDGRRVGYIRVTSLGVRTIWVLEQPFGEPRQLAGTEAVDALFFSPDGGALAYFAEGKLYRVPFAGGRPVVLADSMSRDLATGVWRRDGTLLVNGGVYDLRSVPEGGGPATVVVRRPDDVEGLSYPTLLPDPDKILVTRCSANCGLMSIGTLNLRTGDSSTLVKGAARSWFLPPDRLLYVMQDGAALLVGFDPGTMKMTGTARQVFSDVRLNLAIAPQLDVSADGSRIIYLGGRNCTGGQRQVRIVRVDQRGQATPIDSTWEGVFNYSALSPDGTRLALTVFSEERQNLWVKSLDRGPITRITFEGALNYRPVWLANGREIAFISDQSGPALPYVVRADGSGKPVRLAVPDTAQIDEIEIAPGGQWIVYRRGTVNGNRRLAMFRPGVDSTPTEISSGRFDEYAPTVSPDGRWLAYVGVESGREEVYIRPFPDVTRARWQASTGGGMSPAWSPDGRALYFVAATDQLMKMDVGAGSDFRASAPTAIFSTNSFLLAPYHQSFNISLDGQSFIFAQPVNPSASEEYATVLLDWLPAMAQK